MSILKELDAAVTLADQMKSEEGPIILINVFSVDPAEEDALIDAWVNDADFMKTQPGYISTQMHKGIAGSSTIVNYAVWQSVECFRNAFTHPEFQKLLAEYPSSAKASPHLFRKLSIANHCVA